MCRREARPPAGAACDSSGPMPEPVVCTSPEAARLAVNAGQDVVLVVRAGPVGDETEPARFGGPGRIALFVGDPTAATDLDAAAAMAAELFGFRPGRPHS